MKTFEDGRIEIVKDQQIYLCGKNTNVYSVYEVDEDSKTFVTKVSGRTYTDAYDKYLNYKEEDEVLFAL